MTTVDDCLTTEEAALELGCYRHHIRQVCNLLEYANRIVVPRKRGYRLIRRADLPLIAAELAKRPGWRRRTVETVKA